MSQKSPSKYIRGAEIQLRMLISQKTLNRLVAEGRIGVLAVPGVGRKLYSRVDVEALIEAGTRRATVEPSARELATA